MQTVKLCDPNKTLGSIKCVSCLEAGKRPNGFIFECATSTWGKASRCVLFGVGEICFSGSVSRLFSVFCAAATMANYGPLKRGLNDCSMLCVAQMKAGTVSVGSEVVCKVDYERRANVAPNHTMTHVLNFALRQVKRV